MQFNSIIDNLYKCIKIILNPDRFLRINKMRFPKAETHIYSARTLNIFKENISTSEKMLSHACFHSNFRFLINLKQAS